MAHPRKSPYRRKNLTDIFYISRVIANFVPNFVGMATGVGGKMQLAAFDGPFPNPPHRPRRKNLAKNLLRTPNYSQFCPKFRYYGNGDQSGKNAIGSIRWPIHENPTIRAKISQNVLRKPSYGQFCPKCRCHGNGGRSVKNAIGSIRWPIQENPSIGAKISQKSLTQAEL